MRNSDFNEGYGGGGDSYAGKDDKQNYIAPIEIGKRNSKEKTSYDLVEFQVSPPKADDYEGSNNFFI